MTLPEFKGGETLVFPGGMARVVRVKKPKSLREFEEPVYRLNWRMIINGRQFWLKSKTEYTLEQLAASRLISWEC